MTPRYNQGLRRASVNRSDPEADVLQQITLPPADVPVKWYPYRHIREFTHLQELCDISKDQNV